jgi:hypothetical protein
MDSDMRKTNHFLLFLLVAAWMAACGDNRTLIPERDPYQPGQLEPLSCLPNLDGVIESAELPLVFGVEVSYLVSPAEEERQVDLVGGVDDDGHQVWDWGADYASDQVARMAPMELTGKWYAASFPGGQFAAFFDAGGQIEAVYAQDPNGFTLLGLASARENPDEGQTLLVYTDPVTLYRFPMQVGDDYVSVGEIVDGTFRGLPYAGRDIYETQVDGSGRLVLTDLTFAQVLRVRTRTVVEPAVGVSTSQRQVSFLFECYGEVARATSRPDEPEEDFVTAMEVRRLGF